MKWCSLFLVLVSAVSTFGQSVASLRGHVTDPSGAAIAAAGLKLVSTATGAARETTSDANGGYEFLQLQPGLYSLEASAKGFRTTKKVGLDLLVATASTIDVTLALSSVDQKVEVTADNQPALNTTDATLGNTFNERQISSLPIEGRNVVELLSLQPGVTYLGSSGAGNDDGDSRSGAVNGARSDQSNVTLDGVDVNDQNKGYAFDSVLRMTQDSVGEFRVTTSNPDADAGRGSGAQVSLVTKSGTNTFHGSAYEYNRNRMFTANDYFNKRNQLLNGQPNQQPALIRNVFGAAVGGPVLKDKLFFFANYEGRRDAEGASAERIVPSADMRQGILHYVALDQSIQTLTPTQIQGMDPLGIGVNQKVLEVLNLYPMPNDPTVGDTLNTQGYRFVTTEHRRYNTYIARIDWNVNKNNTLFWRGNLMNDNEPDVPQFPGQVANTTTLTNNKGFVVGLTTILRSNLINNFRWGFVRQGGSNSGASIDTSVSFQGLDSPVSFSRSGSIKIPVNNFIDDLSWSKGNHSFSFGTNIRVIDDGRSSTYNSFSGASVNNGWLAPSTGIAGKGIPFDPAASGYATVSDGRTDPSNPKNNLPDFRNNYDGALMDLVGIVDEGDAVYNYDKHGNPLQPGTPVVREYRWNEYDVYAQDSWRLRKSLTLTAGLKWSYMQVPTEIHGSQVGPCVMNGTACTPFSLSDYVNQSAQQGVMGGAANNIPAVSFDLNGRSNGKKDFWTPQTNNFSPRIALAWSPSFKNGLLSALFGEGGKTSVRAGFGMIYDHFGAGIVNTFDGSGSYGMATNISNQPVVETVTSSPRFTGITTIPPGLLPPPPAGGFPATPDPNSFNISWGIDSAIKTPYSNLIDFSVSREINSSTSIEVSYVGRFAHRLMSQQDVAMPLDLHAAGTDYFAAASALSKMAYAGVDISKVQNAPYWQQLFGALDGVDFGFTNAKGKPLGPLSATQNVYYLVQQNLGNETAVLNILDRPDSATGAGINTGSHTYPSYRFYHSQYSALYAWRSIGQSYYNAMEVVLRHRFRGGVQADFNYTYSKSEDWTSQAERLGTSGGNNNAQIINTWIPAQLRGVSDFDMTHQVNANYVWDLPFGRGRHWMSSSGRVLNAFFGGWEMTGIVRWTSGLPYMIDDGSRWPTNWDIEGFGILNSNVAPGSFKRGTGPQTFADPSAAYSAFRLALPGESGTRNPLRGDGVYSWDAGLNKAFQMTERTKLQFRWEAFNVTNSVRYDPHSINNRLDNPTAFGMASGTLVQPRIMQVALRLEF